MREFVVLMARKDIVREYETACEAAGAQAGIVDLATFNVINAVLAGSQAPTGDCDCRGQARCNVRRPGAVA